MVKEIKPIEQQKEVKVADVKPVEAKLVEKLVEAKTEQPKVEQFKNVSNKGIKIKFVDGRKVKWLTVKPGEVVTVSRRIAQRNKLVKVE